MLTFKLFENSEAFETLRKELKSIQPLDENKRTDELQPEKPIKPVAERPRKHTQVKDKDAP